MVSVKTAAFLDASIILHDKSEARAVANTVPFCGRQLLFNPESLFPVTVVSRVGDKAEQSLASPGSFY